MRSKYGMVAKLFSAQRYDPRKVFESLAWCAKLYKKFSRPPKSYTVDCVIHTFGDTSETLLQNRVAKIVYYAVNCVNLRGPRKFFVRFRTLN